MADHLSTEERIKAAAAKVFTEKGYDATKTRDIAEAANINIASLHYYFRSKEKLFEIIIGERMRQFSAVMQAIMNTDKPLHQKIREFVPAYIDFQKENPYLPLFIMSESQKNAEKIEKLVDSEQVFPNLKNQITKLSAAGIIRPIGIANFMTTLMGLVVFPFLGKPLLKAITGQDERGFEEMLEIRKQMIPEMIINYLYLTAPGEE